MSPPPELESTVFQSMTKFSKAMSLTRYILDIWAIWGYTTMVLYPSLILASEVAIICRLDASVQCCDTSYTYPVAV